MISIRRAKRPLTDRWRDVPVQPRLSTLLGISFRPLQARAFGLDARTTLGALLMYPFHLVRLGAYWSRIESEPGAFQTDELDWQIDAAEKADRQIILCVGPVKTFGYPEFFVPAHHLMRPLREGAVVKPAAYSDLLSAATEFATRIVDLYKERKAIIAWQVEHEAVDPLGMEHSWRLAGDFVEAEVAAVRKADPTRPILMTGFLPTSLPVRLQQWWRTRDQGDSLSVAQRLTDIVGIDYYPRHALVSFAGWTLYLDGTGTPLQDQIPKPLLAWVKTHGGRLMISEGQGEPWETETVPPNPQAMGMYSCLPEHVIQNYNRCLRGAQESALSLDAYLFWGAEYWMLRKHSGDSRYIQAFARILDHA